MPADYNGRWEMVKNENFEEVMKALGESHKLSAPKIDACCRGVEIKTLAHSTLEKEGWVS